MDYYEDRRKKKEFAKLVEQALEKYVARRRKSHPGCSVSSIASELGMVPTTLTKILTGTRSLGFRLAKEIASVVGVSTASTESGQPLIDGELGTYDFEKRIEKADYLFAPNSKVYLQDGTLLHAALVTNVQAREILESLTADLKLAELSFELGPETDAAKVVLLFGIMQAPIKS